jgi:PKD repeat protein
MKPFFYTALFVFIVLSCNRQDNEYELPSPAIVISNPVPCLGEEVQFYYQSEISVSPVWDFGDGTVSTDALVKHVFS